MGEIKEEEDVKKSEKKKVSKKTTSAAGTKVEAIVKKEFTHNGKVAKVGSSVKIDAALMNRLRKSGYV